MAIQNWPKTATSSDWANVDSIKWPEAMLPPDVNDSARAMGRDLAKWRDDINSTITSGGSSNAYTITSNGSYGSLANGFQLSFKASFSNTGAATLNVDSLGAKAIRKFTSAGEAALAANDIVSGGYYWVQYNTAANSAAGGWILLNPATQTIQTDLDTIGSTRGQTLYRGAAAWAALSPSTAGYVLRDGGSGADPSWGAAVNLGTYTASTSGTAIDFTSIPAWARVIVVTLRAVSTSGTSSVGLQLGISSGIESTGYTAAGYDASGAYTSATTNFSDNTTSAANSRYYTYTLTLINSATNTWAVCLVGSFAAGGMRLMTGEKSLSGTLDRVRITAGGVDTFDAGNINIAYW